MEAVMAVLIPDLVKMAVAVAAPPISVWAVQHYQTELSSLVVVQEVVVMEQQVLVEALAEQQARIIILVMEEVAELN